MTRSNMYEFIYKRIKFSWCAVAIISVVILISLARNVFAVNITKDTTIAANDFKYDKQDIVVGNGTNPVTFIIAENRALSNLKMDLEQPQFEA